MLTKRLTLSHGAAFLGLAGWLSLYHMALLLGIILGLRLVVPVSAPGIAYFHLFCLRNLTLCALP